MFFVFGKLLRKGWLVMDGWMVHSCRWWRVEENVCDTAMPVKLLMLAAIMKVQSGASMYDVLLFSDLLILKCRPHIILLKHLVGLLGSIFWYLLARSLSLSLPLSFSNQFKF